MQNEDILQSKGNAGIDRKAQNSSHISLRRLQQITGTDYYSPVMDGPHVPVP
jgi:hypothetical protein